MGHDEVSPPLICALIRPHTRGAAGSGHERVVVGLYDEDAAWPAFQIARAISLCPGELGR
jgi:hypothetical protein